MNKQQVFDYVVNHLRKQGAPARDDKGYYALYRAEGGLTCPVGCLIPDTMYQSSMEGYSVMQLVEMYPLPDVITDNLSILDDVHHVHLFWECWQSFSDIEPKLMYVARKHGVAYNRPCQEQPLSEFAV